MLVAVSGKSPPWRGKAQFLEQTADLVGLNKRGGLKIFIL